METSILRAFLFVAMAASVAVAVEPSAPPVDAYVLVGPRDGNQMSGSLHDLERARAAAGSGPALWVRRDGHEWVIRDAKLLARMRALTAPIDELGRQEGALGAQQGALGAQQGALGRKMGELSRDPERNKQEMETIGRQMEALGAKMEVFGKQMEALGTRMETAEREMKGKLSALVDDARAAALASEVK
jgi:chromosome segregation ATPase